MNLTLTTRPVDGCTMGVLTVGADTFYTAELPWLNNEPFKSCVPAGQYQLMRYVSEKHGLTWRLHNPALNVYGLDDAPAGMRTEVELHSGNVALSESEGCLLVGMAQGAMLDPKTNRVELAVLDSVVAISRLRVLLDGAMEGLDLTITREGLDNGP